jgi:hypothetical protein
VTCIEAFDNLVTEKGACRGVTLSTTLNTARNLIEALPCDVLYINPSTSYHIIIMIGLTPLLSATRSCQTMEHKDN